MVELFEARRPQEPAVITEIDGSVKYGDVKKQYRKIFLTGDDGETREYQLPRGSHINVQEGERVKAGEPLMAAFFDSGAIYDPAIDVWTPTSTAGAPSARMDHTAVWTGSRMIIWGGQVGVFPDLLKRVATQTGGVYSNPAVHPPPPPPSDFFTVAPCRVFDTREPSGPTLGEPLASGSEQRFVVAGRCGVPLGASAVSLSLAGTASTAQGNLRLYAAGTIARWFPA